MPKSSRHGRWDNRHSDDTGSSNFLPMLLDVYDEDRPGILCVANHAFDCIGAKSYGMRTAYIDRRKQPFGQTPRQPDLIVANFAELGATPG